MLLTLHRSIFALVLTVCVAHRVFLPIAILLIGPAFVHLGLPWRPIVSVVALASFLLPPLVAADLARRRSATHQRAALRGAAATSMAGPGAALAAVGLSLISCAAALGNVAHPEGGIVFSTAILGLMLAAQTVYYALDAAFVCNDLWPKQQAA